MDIENVNQSDLMVLMARHRPHLPTGTENIREKHNCEKPWSDI